MSDQPNITTKDVTQALEFFVESMSAFYVDDDHKIRWRGVAARQDVAEDGLVTVGSDPVLPITIYNKNIPKATEAHLLNPFSDGTRDSPATRWFYYTLRMTATGRVMSILGRIVGYAAVEKGGDWKEIPFFKHLTEKPQISYPKSIANMLAMTIPGTKKTVYDEIDAAMAKEIQDFVGKTKDEFLRCDFIQRHQRVDLSLPIISQATEAKLTDLAPSVRKKTLVVIRTLLRAMLKVGDDGDLSAFTTNNEPGLPAKLYCVLSTLYKLYSKLNEYMEWTDADHVQNLDEWNRHINLLAFYNSNARWARPAAETKPPQTTPVMPNAVPTTAVTIPTVQPQMPTVQAQPGSYVPTTTGVPVAVHPQAVPTVQPGYGGYPAPQMGYAPPPTGYGGYPGGYPAPQSGYGGYLGGYQPAQVPPAPPPGWGVPQHPQIQPGMNTWMYPMGRR